MPFILFTVSLQDILSPTYSQQKSPGFNFSAHTRPQPLPSGIRFARRLAYWPSWNLLLLHDLRQRQVSSQHSIIKERFTQESSAQDNTPSQGGHPQTWQFSASSSSFENLLTSLTSNAYSKDVGKKSGSALSPVGTNLLSSLAKNDKISLAPEGMILLGFVRTCFLFFEPDASMNKTSSLILCILIVAIIFDVRFRASLRYSPSYFIT
jgi:hypothetical protein